MAHFSYKLGNNDNEISYLTSSSDKASLCLVCIHGWACQASDFISLFDELSKLESQAPLRVLAIDLPGHGSSSFKDYPIAEVRYMRQAVLKLLNDLSILNVVLVGHSMGVRIILDIWRASQSTSPVNIKGFIFLDGSSYGLRAATFDFDKGNARSQTMSDEEKVKGMQEAFRRMFSPQTPRDFQKAKYNDLKTMNLVYSESIRADFIRYDKEEMTDVLESLERSNVPLLSFQSTDIDEENQRIPVERASSKWICYLQSKVPNARQIVVENSMHFPHVDQPAEVARGVNKFLEGILIEDPTRLLVWASS